MRRWAIINAVLGVLLLLLAWELVRTWGRTLPPPPVDPASRAAAPEGEPQAAREKRRGADRGGNRTAQQPETLVAAIAEKDLFDPSRKPAPPEEAKDGNPEAPKPIEPPQGVTVTGVRIVGKDREVFVEDTSSGQKWQRRLRTGDEVAGWTVKHIEPTAVTLASPTGELVSLTLSLGKGNASPGVPGTPARTTAARPPASPAAGISGASPAAGIPVRPATTTTTPVGVRSTSTTLNPRTRRQRMQGQLPADVQHKLEQLRHDNAQRERKP
jgi:hypothetical protein